MCTVYWVIRTMTKVCGLSAVLEKLEDGGPCKLCILVDFTQPFSQASSSFCFYQTRCCNLVQRVLHMGLGFFQSLFRKELTIRITLQGNPPGIFGVRTDKRWAPFRRYFGRFFFLFRWLTQAQLANVGSFFAARFASIGEAEIWLLTAECGRWKFPRLIGRAGRNHPRPNCSPEGPAGLATALTTWRYCFEGGCPDGPAAFSQLGDLADPCNRAGRL